MRIGYHLSSEKFAPAELLEQAAEAFFLADLPGPARDMGLAEPVRAVRRKVLAALPPVARGFITGRAAVPSGRAGLVHRPRSPAVLNGSCGRGVGRPDV
ncbi:MAG TPA: hypothetical protein VFY84_08195 [Jiangellales bacterium]|nr:hypothetical protein [Jiangellales bacterium]